MRLFTSALVGLLAATLSLAQPSYNMYDIRPLVPAPEPYKALYEQTEDCLDVDGNFGAVHWFVADSIVDSETGRRYAGVRYADNIFFAEDYYNVDTYVRHESIHHILADAGYDADGDHDGWFWDECVKLPLPDGVDKAPGLH